MRTNRIVCMVMAAAMLASAAVAQAEYKTGDKGTFTGKITEKAATWFRAKNDAGESQKFMPKWIGGMPKDGGGFDKEMVAKIKELTVGDKVEVKWEFNEHVRAVEVTVLEKAAEKPKE